MDSLGSDINSPIQISDADIGVSDLFSDFTTILPPTSQTDKEKIMRYAASIYQLNKQDGTFPETVQENSILEDFNNMKEDLRNTRAEYMKKSKKQSSGCMVGNLISNNKFCKDRKTLFQHIESLGGLHDLIASEISHKIDLPTNSKQAEKEPNLEEEMVKLNEMLHEVDSFKSRKKNVKYNPKKFNNHIIALKLQHNLFKTADFMYRQHLIKKEAFTEFYLRGKTREIAGTCMLKNLESDLQQVNFVTKFLTTGDVLGKWKSSAYRSGFKVLEGKNLRYFRYLLVRDLFTAWLSDPREEPEEFLVQLFKDDVLFHILEKYTELKINLSDQELIGLKHTDKKYIQIRKNVGKLLDTFLLPNEEDGYAQSRLIRRKMKCLDVLEFVVENYGDNILTLDRVGTHLKDQMSFMKSSFKLVEDAYNVLEYLLTIVYNQHEQWPQSEWDKLSRGEENEIVESRRRIEMIVTYYEMILSNNDDLLTIWGHQLNNVFPGLALEELEQLINQQASKVDTAIRQLIYLTHPEYATTRLV